MMAFSILFSLCVNFREWILHLNTYGKYFEFEIEIKNSNNVWINREKKVIYVIKTVTGQENKIKNYIENRGLLYLGNID